MVGNQSYIMELKLNEVYDLKIEVGTGKLKRIIKEPKCLYVGVVASEKSNFVQFLRVEPKPEQKRSFAVPRNFITSAV